MAAPLHSRQGALAGRAASPCSTAVGLTGVPACMRRRPWRSCTCCSSWLHRRPRGCRHSRCLRQRRRPPCLPAVRCARLHAHWVPFSFPQLLLTGGPADAAVRVKLAEGQPAAPGLEGPEVVARQRRPLTAGAPRRCRQAAAAGRAGGAGAADASAAGAGTSGMAACCPPTAARLRSRSCCVRGARACACVPRPARRHACRVQLITGTPCAAVAGPSPRCRWWQRCSSA